MKLHLDPDNKQVSVEGNIKLADLFNRLMGWFPEEWDEWVLVAHTPKVVYREVFVEKTNWRNPYWNPWNPITFATSPINAVNLAGSGNLVISNAQNSSITLANSTTNTVQSSNKITLNLNNI